MKAIDLKDLIKTVECLRKEIHPDLDQSFLEAVVSAEERNPEDDEAALREIQNALNNALA